MNLKRFVQAKLRQARQEPTCPKAEVADRLPPGQRQVSHFPVLDLGNRPRIRTGDWALRVDGAVHRPLSLDWQALRSLPRVEVVADIHCVTRWSRLDVRWSGVAARSILEGAEPRADAVFAMLSCHDGYTTNLPLSVLLQDDVLLAYGVDGGALDIEHGGPVRLVVPSRYFWKSAKWVSRIELLAQDRPGFWETRGYHNDADPWQEQRFGRR
jgi:DMSO/TMAO reductase YedYZ molybdopterin-dependent catalytic subunit